MAAAWAAVWELALLAVGAGGSTAAGDTLEAQPPTQPVPHTQTPLPSPLSHSMKRAVPTQMANKGKRQRDEQAQRSTAAVLSSGDEYAAAAGAIPAAEAAAPAAAMPPLGATGVPPSDLVFHQTPMTESLMDSAPQPQLPGRLLTVPDIKVDLKGRQAEMFWPDDNMWCVCACMCACPCASI